MNNFIRFVHPQDVKSGMAVILEAEAARHAFNPFATLLVANISKDEDPAKIRYTLIRPYMTTIEETSATVIRDEIVIIEGFERLRWKVLAHNAGREARYVMTPVSP